MKKALILSLFFLFGASFAYGAVKIQEIKQWDFIAQIQTVNKGNQFIYKVIDGDNICYVMASDKDTWGLNPEISCVNNAQNTPKIK